MTFTSIHFVLFTFLALGIYYLLPLRLQNYWLLLVSYAFAYSWNWQFPLVLGSATAVNFFLAKRLFAENRRRRSLLWLGIGFNLLILVIFRMANFYLPELESTLGRLGVLTVTGGLQILIPIGLSFFVLLNISYLTDVYRGQLKAETDWVNFSLYLAYFPKIIAGPIERAQAFLPKLSQPRVVDNQVAARSLMLIAVGVVRKLLIADVLSGLILTDVFRFPEKYTPPEMALWLVIYAFLLYNDFAGYTDIARGVSGLFGIELSSNFRTPYFSRSFTEFWSRWHITLSEWLRDYIYYPISRAFIRRNPSRLNPNNLIWPPLVTMLASGLWHGFALSMVLWGAMHGVYLISERLLTLRRPSPPSQNQPLWRQGLAMLVVFVLVLLAWVPFRWGLPEAFDVWRALFDWSSFAIRYRRLFLAIPIVLVSLGLDYFQYRSRDEFIFLKWPRVAQSASLAVIFFSILAISGGDFEQPFVYQAF
jgi:D-alanyl-lipoteichoic acid acyltransferase DltB (MBOAT superfamily)